MSLPENVLQHCDPPARTHRRARHRPAGWVKRAGVAGGVIGAVALTSGASPAQARAAQPNPNEVSQTLDLSQLQAAQATDQAALGFRLRAAQQQAAQDAAAAARRKAAARPAKGTGTAAATPAAATAARPASTASAAAAGGNVTAVLAFLQAQVGKAYVFGATGPAAYDCSGLVQAAFRTVGVDLPRTSQAQSGTGTPVSLSALLPGDLVFWGGQGTAYHVGVYIGGGRFLAAQNPRRGIIIEPLSYSQPDFATRVL